MHVYFYLQRINKRRICRKDNGNMDFDEQLIPSPNKFLCPSPEHSESEKFVSKIMHANRHLADRGNYSLYLLNGICLYPCKVSQTTS